MEKVDDIVLHLLQSPQLKETLENAVRQLNPVPVVPSISTTTFSSSPSSSTSRREELERLFPSVKGHNGSALKHIKSRNFIRKKAADIFRKEIILLRNVTSDKTLRGVDKSRAYERGFAFSNVAFELRWTEKQVLKRIEELFPNYLDQIFDILVPIGGHLVKPSLPPGEELNGYNFKNVFHQKVVYIRPTKNIPMLPLSEPAMVLELEPSQQFHHLDHIVTEDINNTADDLDLEELQFQRDTEKAIEESCKEINEVCEKSIEITSLEEILTSLKNKINENNFNQFNVYRADIFACCIRAMRRKNFSPFNKVSVKFSDQEGTSEGAVDAGGPSREMFRLVLKYIRESKLFFGEYGKHILLNTESIEQNEYFEAGRLIALSLIHGGTGPQFFSQTLFSIITDGYSNVIPTVNDVEEEIKVKISKFDEIEDLEELQNYISDETVFHIAGCHFINNAEEKRKIFEDVLKFYAIHRPRAALEQFTEGLSTGGVLDFIKLYPILFKNILCINDVRLSARAIEDLFKVKYSEIGSNKRTVENRTISFWRDLLLDCEDNIAREQNEDLKLEDILIFATGADKIPPLGFETSPTIGFLHTNDLYPLANTCALELSLPVQHQTYTEFKKHVNFGIGNCPDFAFA